MAPARTPSFTPRNPTTDIGLLNREVAAYARRIGPAVTGSPTTRTDAVLVAQFDKILTMHRAIENALRKRKTPSGSPYVANNAGLITTFSNLSLKIRTENIARQQRRSRKTQKIEGKEQIRKDRERAKTALEEVTAQQQQAFTAIESDATMNWFEKGRAKARAKKLFNQKRSDVKAQRRSNVKLEKEIFYLGPIGRSKSFLFKRKQAVTGRRLRA